MQIEYINKVEEFSKVYQWLFLEERILSYIQDKSQTWGTIYW